MGYRQALLNLGKRYLPCGLDIQLRLSCQIRNHKTKTKLQKHRTLQTSHIIWVNTVSPALKATWSRLCLMPLFSLFCSPNVHLIISISRSYHFPELKLLLSQTSVSVLLPCSTFPKGEIHTLVSLTAWESEAESMHLCKCVVTSHRKKEKGRKRIILMYSFLCQEEQWS